MTQHVRMFGLDAVADSVAHLVRTLNGEVTGYVYGLCGAFVPRPAPRGMSPEDMLDNPVCPLCEQLCRGIMPEELTAEEPAPEPVRSMDDLKSLLHVAQVGAPAEPLEDPKPKEAAPEPEPTAAKKASAKK